MKPRRSLTSLEITRRDLLDAECWVKDIKDDPLFSAMDRSRARNYVRLLKADLHRKENL